MKKLLTIMTAILLIMAAPVLYASVTIDEKGTRQGEAVYIDFVGFDVDFSKDTATIADGYKYSYMPFGYVNATSFIAGGIATPITASGVEGAAATGSVVETGAAEGALAMADDADYLLFYMKLPDVFVDGGVAGDLQLAFDMSEGVAAAGTDSFECTIYPLGATRTAILDTNVSMSGTARAYSTAISLGALSGVNTADSTYVVKISPDAAGDDLVVYNARLKVKAGIDNQ